jgi:hypothetical protein
MSIDIKIILKQLIMRFLADARNDNILCDIGGKA